jgi:hypothetical protein
MAKAQDSITALQRVVDSLDSWEPKTEGAKAYAAVADYQSWVFDDSAVFPLRQFDSAGNMRQLTGAFIHEGARLISKNDGRYEFVLVVTAPATRTTLNLKLKLYVSTSDKSTDHCLEERILTFPPIHLFDEESVTNGDRATWVVRVPGYSETFQIADGAARTYSLRERIPEIALDGSATFGVKPEQIRNLDVAFDSDFQD